GPSAERSRHDRGGVGPANGFGLGALFEVVHDRRPDLPVVPLLVLKVVLAEEAGERRLANGVPVPREAPRVVSEHPEVMLEPARDVPLDHEERRRVLPGQHRHVVDLEDPLELLDRGRVLVDPDIDPTVVPSAVPPPLAGPQRGSPGAGRGCPPRSTRTSAPSRAPLLTRTGCSPGTRNPRLPRDRPIPCTSSRCTRRNPPSRRPRRADARPGRCRL